MTKPFYGPEWATQPTPAMIALAAAGTDSIIDMCVFDGGELKIKTERDLFAAWDDGKAAGLDGKADGPSGEVMINSPVGYGERCVQEMGEIPFFKKISDGSYETYNCLDSTEIPMTATDGNGTVNHPQIGTLAKCDKPQYIYSLCEAGPRVAEKTNDQGTHWVLLCRKSIGGLTGDQYNDIAMIGHNPFTGKTCFFQNALYSKTDGGHVPHPADKEKSQNLWSGVHGGAAYDPGFFPDNRGWVFQGTPIGAGFCSMALLQSDPDRIDFSETACNTVEGVSLYQHLGAGLAGGDYFVVNSQFTSDHPSPGTTTDPSAAFGMTATMKLTPMVYNGTHYTGKPSVVMNSPFEGDTVLSPSTTMVVSRFGNESQQLGYVLRKVVATPTATSYTVTTPEIGRYCTQGAKPSISFDERYMAIHHYVGANDYADLGFASAADPVFKDMLAKGTSNLVLVDLTTGASRRITNMHPGQYALYPHWRADGWIYFLVRDKVSNKEYAAASDAAL